MLTAARILILMNPARGYDRALMRGMARYVRNGNPVQFFTPPPFWVDWKSDRLIEFINETKVNGIFMIERDDTDRLLDLQIPMVVSPYSRRRVSGAINLITNHVATGQTAAEHLIQCGFKNFAFCGYENMFWSEDRFKGFRKHLQNHGHKCCKYTGKAASPMDEKVRLLIWLNNLPDSTGIFACADERGRELIELSISSGIRVPDQIGVISVDNDELLCELAPVALSSIDNTAERCGFEAITRLVQIITGKKPNRRKPDLVVEPTGCVARLSTDFINAQDPPLTRSIRFIRENTNKPISVDDVVRESGLSRRVLEKRFRKELNTSVYAEIRRTKVEQFGRMLLESTLTVSEIADRFGFDDIIHLSRYFKTQTGMTPREYRTRYGKDIAPPKETALANRKK